MEVKLKLTTCNFKVGIITLLTITGADPGFPKRGFIRIKVWGFALLNLSHFLNPMKIK